MKIAKFTVKRSDIDQLIYNLQHLKKMADNQHTVRYVAINFLENKEKRLFLKIFKQDASLRVVVQIDRYLK